MMRDVHAFLMGIKPAVLVSKTIAKLPALQKYPRFETVRTVLFFQNDDMLRNFKRDVEARSFYAVLGYYLGFPPKAVEWFRATRDHARFERERVFVNYLGRQFASSIADLEDNVLWLWENVDAPADLRRAVKIERPTKYEIAEIRGKKVRRIADRLEIRVEYGDVEVLREAVDAFKKIGGDALENV